MADIARELGVSPQAVSNWKARDHVPYKYVKILREKIENISTKNKSSQETIHFDQDVFNEDFHDKSLSAIDILSFVVNNLDFERIDSVICPWTSWFRPSLEIVSFKFCHLV